MSSVNSNIESIDTNVLVAFIAKGSDKKQVELAESLILDPNRFFYIPDTVFLETVGALESPKNYAYPRDLIVRYLSVVFDQTNIVCNRPILFDALHFYQDHPAISFGDCLIAAEVSSADAAPLWTFDRKFATQSSPTKQLK